MNPDYGVISIDVSQEVKTSPILGPLDYQEVKTSSILDPNLYLEPETVLKRNNPKRPFKAFRKINR